MTDGYTQGGDGCHRPLLRKEHDLHGLSNGNPEWRRYHRDLRRRYTHPALLLYGLPADWEGHRQAEPADLSWRGAAVLTRMVSLPGHRKRADRLALTHRAPGTGATLTVGSWRVGPYTEYIEAISTRDLARRAGRAVAGPGAAILVDDTMVAFRVLTSGSGDWMAFAQHGDIYLRLDSSGFPSDEVQLVQVHDLEPYLVPQRAGPHT
ncbi:MAG: hypothetical protein ABJB47_08085 [Actinomycetota bacterium]